MNTNNARGRNIAVIIGAYLIAKVIINMIIGGHLSISDLLLAGAMLCALLPGIQFANYAVAAILVIVAAIHLPANIANIGSNWFYLLEGVIDIACAAILVFQSDVKEHFTTIMLKK